MSPFDSYHRRGFGRGNGLPEVVVAFAMIGSATPAAAAPDVVTRPAEVREEAVPADAVVGVRFREALETKVAGLAWRDVPLRDALRGLGETFSVAIVRDRRLDPTRLVALEAAGRPLREAISDVAAGSDGAAGFVGNVAYLGPPEAAAVAATVAELRRGEVAEVRDRALAGRRARLLSARTVRWGDLTEPVEALGLVSGAFGLTVENPEIVPHDLWPGSVLPDVTAPEALTVVLLQFDLTFAWGEGLSSVRLVPLPDPGEIVIERAYAARGSAESVVAEWRERFPGIDARVEGGQVVVRGTVERHEELEPALRKGRATPHASAPKPSDAAPLERRRFTLAVTRVPASAVMETLSGSGVEFDYDAAAFDRAGIDLDSAVTLDVRQADSEEFLEALFGPLGVGFEVDGVRVRLRPSGGGEK